VVEVEVEVEVVERGVTVCRQSAEEIRCAHRLAGSTGAERD
jgi:hypothetical protein